MAVISTNNVVAALKKGSTWGTEADITSGGINLYASQISISGGFGDFLPRDFGQAGKRSNNARLAGNFDVTITCDLTYGQGWIALAAGLLGSEEVPAEVNVGEGDYRSAHDVADLTTGLFWTLVYSIETDRAIAIPSLKVSSMTMTADVNQPGSVTFNCVADAIIESSANTVSEITALTDYEYETATLGGTNHYFRLDSYSTTTALTNADDKTILGFTMAMSRPLQRRFALRGASSRYTQEPLQFGPIDATLQLRLSELDNATFDAFGDWVSPSFKMAEFFIDGSIIGAGANRSIKLQFPYLKIKGQIPAGHDVPNNNSLMLPVVTYDMLKAPAAPSGMTSITDLLRMTEIHPTRSTKWTA